MIRRFGEPVRSGIRYGLRPGAYAVLRQDDHILLTFQAEPDWEFQLPGGGIDTGEHPLRALHREVYEETGWHMTAPRRLGAFRRFVFMPDYDMWAEKLCTIYLARPVMRIGPPTEPGHTAQWVRIDKAPGLLGNDGDRFFLETLL